MDQRLYKQIVSVLVLCILSYPGFSQNETTDEPESDTTNVIFAWKLNNMYTLQEEHVIDTGIDKLHQYNPLFQEGISYSYTGNIGGAYLSNIFYERDLTDFPHLLKPYKIYFRNPEEIVYYNTRRPFTAINYSTQQGSKDVNEETVGILHTQNITKDANAGFKIDYIGGKGHYLNQRSGVTNGTLFGSVKLAAYEMHTNVTLAKLANEQNAGIQADSFLTSAIQTRAIPVNLNQAETQLKYRGFLLTQKFLLGSKPDTTDTLTQIQPRNNFAALTHTLQFDMYRRNFTDDFGQSALVSGSDSQFFDTLFYNRNFTNDSSHYRLLQNQVKIELIENPDKWYSFGGFVGLLNELQYQFSTTADTINSFTSKQSRRSMNNAFIWSLNQNKKYFFTWNFNGKYYLTGYKQNNLQVYSDISLRVSKKYPYQLTGYLRFNEYKPDLFLERYQSNHFRWEQSLGPTTLREIGAVLQNPKLNLKMSTNVINLTNYTYFNTAYEPEQLDRELTVYAARIQKRTKLWKFVFDADAVYQVTNKTNAMSIPSWTLYGSLFFDHVIRFKFTGGAIALQLGADIYYNSKVQGYGYQPVVEQFYVTDVSTGDYPYINPFLNFQIKKMRVFVTYLHLNELFMESTNYFNIIHHPRNPGVLKFGLNWTLYD